MLAEHSAVDPSIPQPAKKLVWSISPESARDIDTAKRNFDRYGKSIATYVALSHKVSIAVMSYICMWSQFVAAFDDMT